MRTSSVAIEADETRWFIDIRNAADAQVVFEAVRLNILPMIRRRLGPTERDILRSGEIFVWEETDQKGGLERWTDGRRWYRNYKRYHCKLSLRYQGPLCMIQVSKPNEGVFTLVAVASSILLFTQVFKGTISLLRGERANYEGGKRSKGSPKVLR